MKKIIYIAIVCSLVVLASCNDFLDRKPYGSTDFREALGSVEGCRTALKGAYGSIRSTYLPTSLSYFDICTDNIVPSSNYANNAGSILTFNWNASDGTVTGIWNNRYGIAVSANNILTFIDEIPGDQTEKDDIKGQCLMLRAFAHFELIRLYGKNYNEATAATDKGVPYTYSNNLYADSVLLNKPRLSVKQVYDNILIDLNAAKGLITNTNINFFTKASAYFLLTRVYLYKKDYTNVINTYNEFQTLFGSTYALATDPADFEKIWSQDTGKEILFRIPLASNELTQARAIGDFWLSDTQPGSPGNARPLYLPTKNSSSTGIYNLYETGVNTDIRRNIYMGTIVCNGSLGNQNLVTKYPGNLINFPSASYRTNMLKIFRYPELMLNYAEALVRQTSPDAPTAVGILNQIRSARGASTYSTSMAAADVLESIYLERRLEFPFEGHYFHDMKRFEKGFVRITQSGAASSAPLTVTANSFRFVWPIPQTEINANKMINEADQNDGYNN